MKGLTDRIRNLSDRAEFFLVITISFTYYIASSLIVLVLNMQRFEMTTFRVLRGIAMEVAILFVVMWILRARGWRVKQITGNFTWPGLLAGFPLFMAYMFLYASIVVTLSAFYPQLASITTVRFIPTAPMFVMLAFILVNSVFEEVLVTGYVVSALTKQGAALAITASAFLRLLYHLYQGPIATLAILPLGLIFAGVFWKWRTLWPLMAAHTLANLFALFTTMRT